MAAPPRERAPDVEVASPRLLTSDEVLRMAEVGIIGETERVELVDGRLYEMTPEGMDHAGSVAEIGTRLIRAFPRAFRLRMQSTLYIDESTFVEPDVLIARGANWGRPEAADVVLIVEVARTSVTGDRGWKADLFATWGAREYWVLDLVRREVVIHTEPAGGRYAVVRTIASGDVRLPEIDARIALADVLPPADAA